MRIHEIRGPFAALLALALTACQETPETPEAPDAPASDSAATTAVFHASHEPRKAEAPFSDAVQVGDLFFLAGQIGMDHGTRTLVEGGIVPETERTISNIAEVLDQHGMTLDDVVKCTVILATMDDFATFNGVYVEHFPNRPARTTFAASGLAAGASIEIEVVAYRSPR